MGEIVTLRRKHVCEAVPENMLVQQFEGEAWYVFVRATLSVESQSGVTGLVFCPFCGEELPDWDERCLDAEPEEEPSPSTVEGVTRALGSANFHGHFWEDDAGKWWTTRADCWDHLAEMGELLPNRPPADPTRDALIKAALSPT